MLVVLVCATCVRAYRGQQSKLVCKHKTAAHKPTFFSAGPLTCLSCSYVTVLLVGPLGWCYMRFRHDILKHRWCMLMVVSALLVEPISRLLRAQLSMVGVTSVTSCLPM